MSVEAVKVFNGESREMLGLLMRSPSHPTPTESGNIPGGDCSQRCNGDTDCVRRCFRNDARVVNPTLDVD